MICLTCDIHHSSLKTGNQLLSPISEIQTAKFMHKMLTESKIKATYFISGKSFIDEWTDLKEICFNERIDLGGHNYYCFKPELYHRITNRILDSYNGHYSFQLWETKKTIHTPYANDKKSALSLIVSYKLQYSSYP